MSKYQQIKEQLTTGLQHAIEQKKCTEIALELLLQNCIMILDLKSIYVNFFVFYF